MDIPEMTRENLFVLLGILHPHRTETEFTVKVWNLFVRKFWSEAKETGTEGIMRAAMQVKWEEL